MSNRWNAPSISPAAADLCAPSKDDRKVDDAAESSACSCWLDGRLGDAEVGVQVANLEASTAVHLTRSDGRRPRFGWVV